MGDAAHPVSPAGGQGANMSIADECIPCWNSDVVGFNPLHQHEWSSSGRIPLAFNANRGLA